MQTTVYYLDRVEAHEIAAMNNIESKFIPLLYGTWFVSVRVAPRQYLECAFPSKPTKRQLRRFRKLCK